MNEGAPVPAHAIGALNSWADLFDPRLTSQLGNEIPYIQGNKLHILARAEDQDHRYKWVRAEATPAHGADRRPFMTIVLYDQTDDSARFLGKLDNEQSEQLALDGPEQILAYRIPSAAL